LSFLTPASIGKLDFGCGFNGGCSADLFRFRGLRGGFGFLRRTNGADNEQNSDDMAADRSIYHGELLK
jgi:hypothetical protein